MRESSNWSRALLILIAASFFQFGVMPRIPLGIVVVDVLPLATVLAALLMGEAWGLAVGATLGLLLDAQLETALGIWMFSLGLVGYLVGRFFSGRLTFEPLPTAALVGGASTAAYLIFLGYAGMTGATALWTVRSLGVTILVSLFGALLALGIAPLLNIPGGIRSAIGLPRSRQRSRSGYRSWR